MMRSSDTYLIQLGKLEFEVVIKLDPPTEAQLIGKSKEKWWQPKGVVIATYRGGAGRYDMVFDIDRDGNVTVELFSASNNGSGVLLTATAKERAFFKDGLRSWIYSKRGRVLLRSARLNILQQLLSTRQHRLDEAAKELAACTNQVKGLQRLIVKEQQ